MLGKPGRPARNFNVPSMTIDRKETDATGLTYVLIKPKNMGPIPKGATLSSARLSVYVSEAGDNIKVQNLFGSWNEASVTYKTTPSRSRQIATLSGKRGKQSVNVLCCAYCSNG